MDEYMRIAEQEWLEGLQKASQPKAPQQAPAPGMLKSLLARMGAARALRPGSRAAPARPR